ncbi:MAG: hypothetical protein QXK12_08750 [Candidatus Nezhaarchaeales archaeon]
MGRRIKWLLIPVALTAISLLPLLAVPLGLYAAYKLVVRVRARLKVEGRTLKDLRSLYTSLKPVKANCVLKVQILQGYEAFLPSPNAPCLLLLKGFTIICRGAIAVKPPIIHMEGDEYVNVLNAAYCMDKPLVYVFFQNPADGEAVRGFSTLLFIGVRRKCLRVNAILIEELVQETLKAIETLQLVLLASGKPFELKVLRGDELVKAYEGVIANGFYP